MNRVGVHGVSPNRKKVRMTGRAMVLVAVTVAILVVGCGASEPTNGQRSKTTKQALADQLRPVQWKVFGRPSGRRVKIVSELGHCVGTERSRIAVVHIVERPRRSLITAMLKVPRVGRRQGEGCAGVGIAIFKKIRLDRRVVGRALYDASTVPPQRRWPRR